MMRSRSPCVPPVRTHLGFTLIELMVTLIIVAILLAIGLPQMREFISDQRVRAAISDIQGDLAFARADAMGNQRRDLVLATNLTDWNGGWSVCIESSPITSPPTCAAGSPLRASPALGGQLKSCASATGLIRLAFTPDGTVDVNPPLVDNDYIRVSDDMGDTDASNDKIRSIYFAPMGRRMHVERENGGINGATPCT